ncbi:MAG TPA: hypothetical protein VGN61_03150 [Verrucomicrobiae bacterium]
MNTVESSTGIEKKAIDNTLGWNKSLISRNLVRMEGAQYPDESETDCHKRVMVALVVFLAMLFVLSAAVVCLIRAKL